jgi:hypothetical protein
MLGAVCAAGNYLMEKEYGKLTEDQFKRLVRTPSESRKQEGELQEAFGDPIQNSESLYRPGKT